VTPSWQVGGQQLCRLLVSSIRLFYRIAAKTSLAILRVNGIPLEGDSGCSGLSNSSYLTGFCLCKSAWRLDQRPWNLAFRNKERTVAKGDRGKVFVCVSPPPSHSRRGQSVDHNAGRSHGWHVRRGLLTGERRSKRSNIEEHKFATRNFKLMCGVPHLNKRRRNQLDK
jgi:hypothetical protein